MNKTEATSNQKQFWLLNKLQPQNPAYNIPSLFHIKGNLNIEYFKNCLEKTIQNHEIYRTVFLWEDETLYQIINDFADLDFYLIRIGATNRESVEKMIQKKIIEPFDISRGPLFKTFLFQTDSQEFKLLFLTHHIISDLQTKNLFSTELSNLYNSISSGDRLKTDSYQYTNYSFWQSDFFKTPKFDAMLKYWQNALKGFTTYLNLPTDKPRQPVQNIKGNAVPINFSKKMTSCLKQFSRESSADIFLMLLTAYFILLYRYCKQEDIIIGVPLTNRRQEFHKNILGCFVNILPIAANISGTLSFQETLQLIRKTMLSAHRNQEVPFTNILANLPLKTDNSYNPIFQVGFTFEPPMELDLNGLKVIPEKIHNNGAQLDLFLNFWETDNELHGFFEFNTELFSVETIKRMLGNYKTLLKEIIKHPDEKIDCLDLLSNDEIKNLNRWNSTAKTLPENPLIHVQFETQSERTPHNTAFIYANERLTYEQLNIKSNQLAWYLKTSSIQPGDLVGIFMDRSINMAVSLYAVLKAGAAYVPMDPAFPEERIAYMIENSCLKTILTEEKTAQLLPDIKLTPVFLDNIQKQLEELPSTNLDINLSPENLAYVIYTSGTTGKPKGVQVPHRAVVNFLGSMAEKPGITEKDILLSVTTLSFDIAVLELFLPQTIGAATVIAGKEDVVDGTSLKGLIQTHSVSIMQATPVTWYILITAGWKGSKNFKILCGGEPVPFELARKLIKRSSSLWNMYGPTETTVWSTCCQIKDTDTQILVGRPIDNTQTYIVNRENRLNPAGITGELLIGGDGVTHGYLNRQELYEKVFIPDTVNEKPSPYPLYRTGDMACYLPDGSIKVLGRIDNQIKLRGYRIELGEIESALESHPFVHRSAVIVREDSPGDRILAAYIKLTDDSNFSESDLRGYLKNKLPGYMIPSLFVYLADMPMTQNGKIDRKSLPEPEKEKLFTDDTFFNPETSIEKDLSLLWGQVLKRKSVSTHSNFFEIGGNSLLSVQLTALIKKETGISIPIAKFYQHSTIASLSKYIDQSKDNSRLKESQLQNRHSQIKNTVKKRQLAHQRIRLKRGKNVR